MEWKEGLIAIRTEIITNDLLPRSNFVVLSRSKIHPRFPEPIFVILTELIWKRGKDPHPQDKSQHLDFTKDPRPLYYRTPPCVFCHKNVCSKAVFGP